MKAELPRPGDSSDNRRPTAPTTSGVVGPPHPWRRRIRSLLLGAMIVVVGLAVVGAAAETLLERRDQRVYTAPGELVDVGDGRRLHMLVSGAEHDGTTVILEAGTGGFSSDWAWTQSKVAEHATVVSYDRAGLGWSDPRQDDLTASGAVADLRAGLDAQGINGPYVLVGHSSGGFLIRAFADTYPDDTAGLVFVDASHEDGFVIDSDSGQRTGIDWVSRVAQGLARVGVVRVFNQFGQAALPRDQQGAYLAMTSTPGYIAASIDEYGAVNRLARSMGDTRDLGDIPVRVLSASDGDADFAALQPDLATLSSNGRHDVIEGSNHSSIIGQQDNASEVSAAIIDLLDTVQSPSD
jgi:pimeloyl-ACP methyl ester carboxylesterase